MSIVIPDEIVDALEQVSTYASAATEWVVVKKEVMKFLPPKLRKNFSTRDPKTKKQSFNQFELAVLEWWLSKTGVKLVISE